MFFGNVLLDRRGPYALLWRAAHGKSLPRSEVKHFDAVQKCENLIERIPGPLTRIDTQTKFSLYLISNLLYGIVIVVKRQTDILLADVEELRGVFCIGTKGKRKRLFFGETSFVNTPKRAKFIEDMDINMLSPITEHIDSMDKLDQAFLNNRIEVARIEDITLKENEIGMDIYERFSDALTDFGEKSTEYEQIFMDATGRDLQKNAQDYVVTHNEQQCDENLSRTAVESLPKASDTSVGARTSMGPILQSVENVEPEADKSLDRNIQQKTRKPKSRDRGRMRGMRRKIYDKETTIPLEEFNERIKNSTLYQRSRSSLFDDGNNSCERLLSERKFATKFANMFFGEEWVPKPREVVPMSFDEALRYGRSMNISGDIFSRLAEVESSQHSEEIMKEAPRNISSTFMRADSLQVTKSSGTTGLTEDLRISSVHDSSPFLIPKISTLNSITLEDEPEDRNNSVKVSDLLDDISLSCTTISQEKSCRENVPSPLNEIRDENHPSREGVPEERREGVPEECREDVPEERREDVPEERREDVPEERRQDAVEIPERNLFHEFISPPPLNFSPNPVAASEGSKLSVYTSTVSANDFLQQIHSSLEKEGGFLLFSELVHSFSRAAIAKCFYFLLALMKDEEIKAVQEVPFGDIKISKLAG